MHWEGVLTRSARGLEAEFSEGGASIYFMAALAAAILLLSVMELARGRRHFEILVLLNLIFFAAATLEFVARVLSESVDAQGQLATSDDVERQPAFHIAVCWGHLMGLFYFSFFSLLLLLCCYVAYGVRERRGRKEGAL